MGWFSAPTPIDLNKLQEIGTSPYTGQIDDFNAQLIDPDSSLNQAWLQNQQKVSQDQMYQSNRINRMNNANSGINMSGIVQSQNQQNVTNTGNQLFEAMNNRIQNNQGQYLNTLMSQQSQDNQLRDTMMSAYGQNITNKNNYNASMAGNVMNLAGGLMTGGGFGEGGASSMLSLVMCDAKMKENVKPFGKIKLKNGKTTGLYSFNYKGRKKKHINVIAQEVRKHLPEAVQKGKNGLLYVDWKKLV